MEHAFDPRDRDAVYRAIHTRRDVRSYRPDPVPAPVLRRILLAAHHAPSVGFMQPWSFLVIEDRGVRERVYACFRAANEAASTAWTDDRAATYRALKLQGILDAPMNLAVTCDPERAGPVVLGRQSIRETDEYSTCLSVQNLWLAARAEGVGVGWMSIMDPELVKAELGIPERVILVAYLTLGWPVELPAEPMLQSVGWRRRLSLDDLVYTDRWGQRRHPAAEEPVGSGGGSTPSTATPPVMDAATRNLQLTKPPGSLGRLEGVALQVAAFQGRSHPAHHHRHLIIAAGDHGVTEEGVSAYRSDVTARMVVQFVAGGAAVNAFARQHGLSLHVLDVGVDHDFTGATGLVHAKVRRGTRCFTRASAMTAEECESAIQAGRDIVAGLETLDLLGVGEMGIGNSTSAAAVVSALLGVDPAEVVGRGTGVGDRTWAHKVDVVRRGLELHRGADPLVALGGYELAAIVGMLQEAHRRRVPVVLDGFITGAAALAAWTREPGLSEGWIAAHVSAEMGHRRVLDVLGLEPLLDLGLRLGEGSGAALALGLVEAGCRVFSEVRTFEEAGMDDPAVPAART